VGALVYWMGRRPDGRTDPNRLLLAGVLMGSVCIALTMAVLIFHGELAQGVFFFYVVGSLNARTWGDWATLWPIALVVIPLALACASRANVLHLSDGVGTSLGIRVERVRVALLVVATLLTVGAVSAVGGLTFIGFLAPHLARRMVGDDTRRLFLASAALGSVLLLGAGVLTKLLTFDFGPDDATPPLGIPVGAVVAVLGAPLLLSLLLRRNRVA
jgi:iron complex transport system permease protein